MIRRPNNTSSPRSCVTSRGCFPYRLMEGTNVTLKQTVLKSIVGGSLLAAVAMAQSPTYKVIDLGTVGLNGQPFAVTKNGLVAGAAQTGDILSAEVWYKGRVV